MYILALNGSPHKDGNTAYLLDEVLKSAQSMGAETEVEYLQEALLWCTTPFCMDCSTPCSGNCYKGTKLEEIFEKMKRADAVVAGSPVYFGTLSAQLKSFFDKSRRLRGEKAFLGKYGAAVTSGATKYGGQQTTMRAIHDMMLVQGMIIVGDSTEADVERQMGHHGVGAARPARDDGYAVSRAQALGLQLALLCGKK